MRQADIKIRAALKKLEVEKLINKYEEKLGKLINADDLKLELARLFTKAMN